MKLHSCGAYCIQNCDGGNGKLVMMFVIFYSQACDNVGDIGGTSFDGGTSSMVMMLQI